MSKVWGFGTATIDFRIQTADYGDDYKEKLTAQETFILGGGSVANFLTQASRLGAQTGWLGKIGADLLGRKIIAMMEVEGIDCSQAIYTEEMCSPFNLAVYSGEQMRRRCGFLIPNSLNSLTDADLDYLSQAVQPGDYVMVEIGEINLDLTIAFMKRIKECDAIIVVDVDLDPIAQCRGTPEQWNTICSFANILMPNRTAVASIYQGLKDEDILKRMYEEYSKVVILSDSSNGSMYIENSTIVRKTAYKLDAICDSVGAGDAFHGGVVYALAAGKTLDEAVQMGNLCGAMNCTAFGARSGMPTLEQAELFKEEYENGHL